MDILFYISGIITASSIIGLFIYRSKYINLKEGEDIKSKLIVSLQSYKTNKESKKRRAKLTTTGWHVSSESNSTNKTIWDVVFELKEVAQSSDDEKKFKFEVLDVFSAEKDGNDNWKSDDYIKWFTKTTGGGWVDIESDKFEWITLTSKSEIREDKLDQLGI